MFALWLRVCKCASNFSVYSKHSEHYALCCCYHCIRVDPAHLCCPLMPSFRFVSAMFFCGVSAEQQAVRYASSDGKLPVASCRFLFNIGDNKNY